MRKKQITKKKKVGDSNINLSHKPASSFKGRGANEDLPLFIGDDLDFEDLDDLDHLI